MPSAFCENIEISPFAIVANRNYAYAPFWYMKLFSHNNKLFSFTNKYHRIGYR